MHERKLPGHKVGSGYEECVNLCRSFARDCVDNLNERLDDLGKLGPTKLFRAGKWPKIKAQQEKKCREWLLGCSKLFRHKLPGFDLKAAERELPTFCAIMEAHHELESFTQGLTNILGSADSKSSYVFKQLIARRHRLSSARVQHPIVQGMQLCSNLGRGVSLLPLLSNMEVLARALKQHKGEENPMAAAEEEYGENMWGTIASVAFSNPTSATGECDWLTLHQRMGHVALPILQQLVKNEMVAGIRVKGEPDEVLGCPTCMQAKFTRFPFSSSEATAKAPLDEVVIDVVGPLKLGAAGAEYFLTIVDVYTRMTWVYVLSKKSDVAETVKTDWLPMVERQQDRLVKAIRTDRGGEFLSKEFALWLKKNGIRHSLTMPYSPAMNGIAERANRTFTETARGLLIEAGLPEYFWPDAVWSVCVAKNRALTHVGADKWVSYVEWIRRKPKVDMLRVFGCMCMALVPKHLRHNKLGAKAIWAVHLGMAQNSKGWLLWDPFTKKFLVSRDCKFMENLMYKDWKAENEAKIGMRFGEVKSSGLEHVELPLELSSGSTTTRQSSLVNGGVTPQQRQGLHVPAAEEEGRGKRRTQAPNRLTYEALGKPAKSARAALIVGEDEESDYDECAFAFFSSVEMPGEPATLKEALESSDAEEWKKVMESELKSIEENGTWEL
ncbi:unnamed protein product, partial [Closterium sp. NIES-54]